MQTGVAISLETLIGTISDFEKFTFNLVEEAKEFKRAFRRKNCLLHPSMMSKVSSAYRRIGKSLAYYTEELGV